MEKSDVMRLDGHSLRVFLSIFELGSVGKTATAFGLNQSTISHTLEKLRSGLNDQLFVKSGRGITPTERAIELAPRVQELLAGIEGLVASGSYDPARDKNPIVVGLPTPALITEMKRVHERLAALAPDARFEVRRLAPRETLPEMLTQGDADVAIAINSGRLPPVLERAHYGSDELVVFYDPAHREAVNSIEEFTDARHGVTSFGGSTKSVVEGALEAMGLTRKITFVAPTASTLGDFIKGTDVIATMPKRLADNAYSSLAYCDPPVVLPEIRYDLVWHRRFENSGRNRWIRNLLLDCEQS